MRNQDVIGKEVSPMKINPIITGSTGMVGRSVLLECLQNKHVESILVINRRPTGLDHPKLKEIIHKNFLDFTPIKHKLKGYHACFFCMGISSMGVTKEEYFKNTYCITEHIATTLFELSPSMVFNYVSGYGTDSTESKSIMWARVKGQTENMILNKGFKDAYAFRPGIILPRKGVRSSSGLTNVFYAMISPLFPLLKNMKSVTTSERIGQAMINTLLYPQSLKHLENRNINQLAMKK